MEPKPNSQLALVHPGDQYKNLSLPDAKELAGAMVTAGMFPDIKSANTAYIKILAGQEMGISPFQAMTGIHIIQGRAQLAANLMATKVQESGRYRYRVMVLDDNICHIDFQALENGKWVKIGESRFTAEDARKAGTQNMGKFPKNMLFARALSNGVKWFTPDVFGGAPVYVEGEMIETEEGSENMPTAEEVAQRHEEERLAKRQAAAKAGQRVKAAKEPAPEPEAQETAPNDPDEPTNDNPEPDAAPEDAPAATPPAQDLNAAAQEAAARIAPDPEPEAPAEEEVETIGFDDEQELHTPEQRKRAMAMLNELGFRSDPEKRQIVAGILGLKEVVSFTTITKAQAVKLIDGLMTNPGEDVDSKGQALRGMFIDLEAK